MVFAYYFSELRTPPPTYTQPKVEVYIPFFVTLLTKLNMTCPHMTGSYDQSAKCSRAAAGCLIKQNSVTSNAPKVKHSSALDQSTTSPSDHHFALMFQGIIKSS